MDPTHIHLFINHVPVLGTIFGALLLLYALVAKKQEVLLASMGLFVIAGLGAGIAYLTGESTEHTVEGLPGVAESFIEAHEEAALIALIAAIVLGVGALLILLFGRKRTPRWAAIATLVVALGTSGVMTWTANLGGQVRHTEIRDAALTVSPSDEAESDQGERTTENERDD